MSTTTNAGIEMSFRIGQHVRHRDYKGRRVTGTIRGPCIEPDAGLMITCGLDEPIVIPAGDGYAPIDIYTQHAPAHEFSPFDERDELIAQMREALEAEQKWRARERDRTLEPEWDYEVMVGAKRRAAIAAATGDKA